MKNGKTLAVVAAALIVVLFIAFVYVNNAILSWQ